MYKRQDKLLVLLPEDTQGQREADRKVWSMKILPAYRQELEENLPDQKNVAPVSYTHLGVQFAIVRAGYRGSVTGSLVEDPQFVANMKGATRCV